MGDLKPFLKYVIPAVLSFAFSGVYSIVDGYFIGNCVGGAVHYSISRAAGKEKRARSCTAGALWLLLLSGVLFTVIISAVNEPVLRLPGRKKKL